MLVIIVGGLLIAWALARPIRSVLGLLPPPEAPRTFSSIGPGILPQPFALAGGTYAVAWSARPAQVGWPDPTWHFGAAIHAPGTTGAQYRLLISRDAVPATGKQGGQAIVSDIPPGTYVLDVSAGAPFAWQLTLTQQP